jgi:hypothetical protein
MPGTAIRPRDRDTWNRCRFDRHSAGGTLRELLPARQSPRPTSGLLDSLHHLQPEGPARGRHRRALGCLVRRRARARHRRQGRAPHRLLRIRRRKAWGAHRHATLKEGRLEGGAARHEHRIDWDLTWDDPQSPLLMFPETSMPVRSRRRRPWSAPRTPSFTERSPSTASAMRSTAGAAARTTTGEASTPTTTPSARSRASTAPPTASWNAQRPA